MLSFSVGERILAERMTAHIAGLDISPSTVSRILETTVREGCRRTGTFKIRKKKKVIEKPRNGDPVHVGAEEVRQSLEPTITSTSVDNDSSPHVIA